MRNRLKYICVTALLVLSCAGLSHCVKSLGDDRNAKTQEPQSSGLIFSDTAPSAPVLDEDGGPWNFAKLTLQANSLKRKAGPGGAALYAFADRSDGAVSKASANFTDFKVMSDETVELRFCVWSAAHADLSDVFIADLECVFCWPEPTEAPNPSPGIRLHLKDEKGYPVIERAKIGLGRDSLRPPENLRDGLPRDRWVPIVWRVTLGETRNMGRVQLYVDSVRVIDEDAQTLPDFDAFADQDIRLSAQKYDSLEIGVTANSSGAPLELGFKNIQFFKQEIGNNRSSEISCEP